MKDKQDSSNHNILYHFHTKYFSPKKKTDPSIFFIKMTILPQNPMINRSINDKIKPLIKNDNYYITINANGPIDHVQLFTLRFHVPFRSN